MRRKSLALALSLLLFIPISALADDVITINLTRDPLFGFTGQLQQSYIRVTAGPSAPSICYVLSPGGGGGLFVAVTGNRLGVNSVNFLVRSRHLLAGAAQVIPGHEALQGSCVAVLDAATDFLFASPEDRILRDFRRSDERIFDIAAVIADLRTSFGADLRVVLVGTSRGTIDMAEFAARVGAEQLDVRVLALVETATLFQGTTNNPDDVFNVNLRQIRVPTAIIHHEQDGCVATPVEDVEVFADALVHARAVRVRLFEGGFPPVDPNPCQATTFHGFLGKEPQVILAITRFVDHEVR